MGNAVVHDLSAEKQELKRLQASISAKKTVILARYKDPFTSIPNLNLNVKQQTFLNPCATQYAPTLLFKAFQPWSMPLFIAQLQAQPLRAQ